MKKYQTGIYVGKFFPFQLGHLQTLNKISSLCEKVFLVFYYNEEEEKRLFKEISYSISERIEDVSQILKNENIEIVKFVPSPDLKFPNDYLKIKQELFQQIQVDRIDVQIIGADEEKKYKDTIYADHYVTGENIYEKGIAIHASLIRGEYDTYKYLLHPVIRKRLDDLLGKQKYICLVGKSGTGKSSIADILEKRLENSIHLDIDKIVHESHLDSQVKSEILKIVPGDILDDDHHIDRKKLGNILFQNPELKNKVYAITWEYVNHMIQEIVKKNYHYIILDWYNINTKSYWNLATVKILTDRDYESRKQEVLKRDHITPEYFDLREKNSNQYDNLVYDYKVNFSDTHLLNSIIDLLK